MIRLLLAVLVIGGLTVLILQQNTTPSGSDSATDGKLYGQEFDKAKSVQDMLNEAVQDRDQEMP